MTEAKDTAIRQYQITILPGVSQILLQFEESNFDWAYNQIVRMHR